MRRTISWAILASAGVLNLILWLIYTNNTGFREIIAGLLAAAISTYAAATYAKSTNVCFRFRVRDVLQSLYLPWYCITGAAQIFQALIRQLFTADGAPSLMAAVPFNVGGDDPKCAGNRALAVSLTTITPDIVVVGLIEQQGVMLLHQILPERVPAMTRHLGARP